MAVFSAAELLSRHNISYRQTRSGKYTTSCPQCNGEGYLSVKIDSKGVQWHCQSCDEGDGEYFEQYDERSKPTVDYSNPKAVYDYVDESGARLFQALRFETDTGLKVFRQRTGPDQKPWSIKGVRIVPYRLPELVADISRGSAVFVVEGEKDVDTLRRRGIPATCNPMGAKKWWPDFNKILAGADIVICGDNDEPGREHVALVARNLRPVVKRLRVLDLASAWPEIEESQDISDWFGVGLEVEKLLALVDGLPDWTPAPEPVANGHDSEVWPADQPPESYQDSIRATRAEPTEPVAKPVHATRFVYRNPSLIPPREFLYGKHSVRGFMSATASSGGIGKTTLILSESFSIATGRSLLGVPVHDRSAVWYIGLEDPLEEYERRAAAIILRHGIDGEEELAGMFFLDSGRDQNFVVATEARAGVTIARPVVDSLIAEIKSNKISKLIIDPFVAAHKVSENDNAKIGEVARVFSEIAHATDCSVELIHHFRKTAPGVEATADDMRGAKALADHARSVRILSTMSTQEAERMDVSEADRWKYFKVVYGKENLSSRSDKAEWIYLESVSLGNAGVDKRGIARPDDKIGVAVPWKPPTAWDEIGIEDLRAAQAAVSKGRWRADAQAKDWAGVAIAEALGLDLKVKSDKAKISEYLKVWIDNGQFSRVQEMDEKRMKKWFIRVGGYVHPDIAESETEGEELQF